MKLKFVFFYFIFFLGLDVTISQIQIDSVAYQSRKFDNLKEKYSDSDFNYIEKPVKVDTNAWDRFWNEVGRFLSNLFDFGNGPNSLSGLEITMKVIAILIILFVVYLIVKTIINKEGGWIFSKSSNKITVSETSEENIHALDFNTLITKVKNEKNYRLATRYYYLWLLKTFSDKSIIEWDIEKTNGDYLNEIKTIELKNEFQFLSYVYEYSWYGEFDLTETDFEKTEIAFLKLITKK
ncbi:DUF4129 domain-containing protein [Flavobacterium lacisediminis]|uniref:DUF4129 domain-containing protein n=1 Tax=Flavobacterium lacisediminis TaxID=2989705 RepID=A0ABT3EGC8_9FLAO|nr:DUF4129 domain-containing protein [Flavobacterium lacisediminis]MCW1147630.1 DUF4129 domain-containing protein [Flavobacterium lacisediminis]